MTLGGKKVEWGFSITGFFGFLKKKKSWSTQMGLWKVLTNDGSNFKDWVYNSVVTFLDLILNKLE